MTEDTTTMPEEVEAPGAEEKANEPETDGVGQAKEESEPTPDAAE